MSFEIGLTSVAIYEEEEMGDTHVAIYGYANGNPVLQWNNNDKKLNEPFTAEFDPGIKIPLDSQVGPR